ncbi:hypothetical protein ACFVH9_07185 [Streptomyces hirsutus]|uniref:hypothetical protein n=1 Tax=Streptomyces hirsutus TaxID=35620 RepID=UPI00362956DF
MTSTSTSGRAAAAVFTAVFNVAFDDNSWVTVAVRQPGGTGVHVTGDRTPDGVVTFDPDDLEMLLDYLARLLGGHRPAVVTVSAAREPEGPEADVWAWRLPTGDPVGLAAAGAWLAPGETYRGHEYGCGLCLEIVDSPDWASLAEGVKGILRARGLTRQSP